MYKLLNWLFGWHYIQWRNPSDSGVARVYVDGMGRIYYWRYRCTEVLDYIKNPEQVCWLTCSPKVYFKEYGEK